LKNKTYKTLSIITLFVFFLSVPFLQSLIFSTNSQGKIEVSKKIDASYINSDKKFVLLFFGYVGCTDVCTPLLSSLSSLYESKEFKDVREDVDIIFVNLTPEVQEHQPELFAKFFNPAFKGVYLSRRETLSIDRTFGVFFSRSMSDKTELNHTDFLYLIQNTPNSKKLKSMYSVHPFNKAKIIEDLK
jgi:protein SCO1/2